MSVTYLKSEPTGGANYKLTPKQRLALPLIVTGKSGVQVAEAVDVSPVTVSGWINHHVEFQRAMTIETEAVQEQARRILQAGAADAAKTLVETATSGQNSANKTKAAELVLTRTGAIDDPNHSKVGLSPHVAALLELLQQRRAAQHG